MTRITRHYRFEAAHRLPHHAGKCRRLHGHSYEVVVELDGEPRPVDGASDEGMVLDFGDLDAVIRPLLEEWDHRTLLWWRDMLASALEASGEAPVSMAEPPTAEYLARCVQAWLVERLPLADGRLFGLRVTVSEGPRASATVPA